jgi:hypothetical protein
MRIFPPLDFEGRGTIRRMVEGPVDAVKNPSTGFAGPPPLQMQWRRINVEAA